jgi:hypothetical protein
MFESIIALLEANIPANPENPKHQRFELIAYKALRDYFEDIKDAFPYKKLAAIYHSYVQEAGELEANELIEPVLNFFRASLISKLSDAYIGLYIAGSAEMIEWGKTKGGRPIYFEGDPAKQAIEYANTRTATLIRGMDEESKKIIRSVIADGIENKKGIPGIERALRSEFNDMKKARSVMIARTETCDALEQSFMDNARLMGINGKEWVVTVPCETCAMNAGQVVLLDQVFPSGHLRPPAHPNCRCALAPVMID